ncbi:SRR1-like protein isoform X2 [Chanos chanos]|nr:SRR1-like protein isoform X2 [Chanos chanos]
MDSGEWQVARRRKGAARREKPASTIQQHSPHAADSHRDKERIKDAMNELRGEDFWLEWKELLKSCLSACAFGSSEDGGGVVSETQLDCVCYGLGSFSTCVSARYQLAMLLMLLDTLQIPVGRCCVYDPVFSVSECETLRDLGLSVLTENEEGKRAVSRPTLFYLMHCGKALYNNLLWKNWSPQTLPKVIVIGNSFHGIQER